MRRKGWKPNGGLRISASSTKKILIMGGTRFIGVFLSRLLVKEGHQVVSPSCLFLFLFSPFPFTVSVSDNFPSLIKQFNKSIALLLFYMLSNILDTLINLRVHIIFGRWLYSPEEKRPSLNNCRGNLKRIILIFLQRYAINYDWKFYHSIRNALMYRYYQAA